MWLIDVGDMAVVSCWFCGGWSASEGDEDSRVPSGQTWGCLFGSNEGWGARCGGEASVLLLKMKL